MSANNVRNVFAGLAVVALVVFIPAVAAMEWSGPQLLNSNASTDGNVGDYYPKMATDGQGNWVCVWCAANVSLSPRDFDILVSRSSDDGATWSDPALLDPAGADPLEVEDDFHPRVYTDGNGHWIAAWYSYESRGGALGSDVDILVSRSADNGATWTASVPLNSDATTDNVDYIYCSDNQPDLAYDGNGNWVAIWYTKRTNSEDDYDTDIYVSRSSDHGATWSPMELLHADLAADSGSDSSPRIAADTIGNLVVTWKSDNLIGSNGLGDEDVHFSRSTDYGVTWSSPAALNTDASTEELRDAYSGGLDILTDGSLWVTVWVRRLPPFVDYDLMISRSTDAGTTWSPPGNLNPDYDVDGGYKDLYPRLGTDGDGSWVVVWGGYYTSFFPWGSDHDVIFMRSDDAAQTWSQPAVVNAHAYVDMTSRDEKPTVAVTPHGRWITMWFSTYNLGGAIGYDRDILYATSCTPVMAGDHDCDGDVDLVDFDEFVLCLSGPKEGSSFVAPSATCQEAFDFAIADGDIDLQDFAAFQEAFNESGS